MEDRYNWSRAGIPLGHKVFAFLLAAGIAAGGCYGLIWQSHRSARTAVLALDPAQAQHAGTLSASRPVVALADSLLTDRVVAGLAQQAHVASSTSAGQVGVFRSELRLTQPQVSLLKQPRLPFTPGRLRPQLEVRFEAADASQAVAAANAVARVLVAGPPPAANPTPPVQPKAAEPAPVLQAAPVDQGQSDPATVEGGSATGPAGDALSGPLLSKALRQLGAQLSATDRQVRQLAASESGSSYDERLQKGVLKSEAGHAEQTLNGMPGRYKAELANAKIRDRFSKIRQAVGSILTAGHRRGFNPAGVSARELAAQRSALQQAIDTLNRETGAIQAAEVKLSATGSKADANGGANAPPPAATGSSAPSGDSSTAAGAAVSGLQEQNVPAPAGQAAAPSSASAFRMVRLAGAYERPPLWPAIVAGVVFFLIYLGIAALVYRRRRDELYQGVSLAPARMITAPEAMRFEDSPAEQPEFPGLEPEPRRRAGFQFESAPDQEGGTARNQPDQSGERTRERVAAAAPAASGEVLSGSPHKPRQTESFKSLED